MRNGQRTGSRGGTRGDTLRAIVVVILAVAVGALTWRLRPSTGPAAGSSDADIVAGCAWLIWALVGYLALAVAATAVVRVGRSIGLALDVVASIAPGSLRRLVDRTITVGVVAATLGAVGTGSVGLAGAAPAHTPARAEALDWPGLAATTLITTAPPHHADRPPDPVVVRAGDTLWSIAADHLGPAASSAAITSAWQEWYSANRSVIGPDPGVILPGQRLVPPPHSTAPHDPRSAP